MKFFGATCIFSTYDTCNELSKGKALPQHTYGGAGGRGGIAPTN
jgi:hypothetical protein